LGEVVFSNANGLSFGVDGQTVTGSYTVPSTAGLLSNINVSAGTTSNNLSAITFSNANGVSFGLDASTITASIAPGLTNIRVSAGTTSNLLSAVTFSNANGISFGLNASTVTASHNALTSQTNQQMTLFATGNTTQSSTGTTNASSVIFRGEGIASVGITGGSVVVSATQSNQAFSAAGGSSAFQTLGFSDNSNASFTNTNGSVAVASVRASLFAVSNTTQSSSGTQNLNAISFNGAGIASVGVSNGSVVISVPAGGGGGDGGVFAGVSTAGNTAGSTGTVSTGNFVLVGSNGITLSQSTGAAGSAATVTILGNQVVRPGHHPYDDYVQVVGQVGQASLLIDPQGMPNFVCDRFGVFIQNSNATNSSGSHTLSFWLGLYTRTSNSISLYTSWSGSTAVTHSGTVGSYSLYSGGRQFQVTFPEITITENRYWVAFVSRTTSAGANGTYSNYLVSNINSTYSGIFGSATNASLQARLGQGYYSVTTSGMPNSIAFSQLIGNSSAVKRFVVVGFPYSTY
jgi:hypothetical protein